jgi:hypothetical protein
VTDDDQTRLADSGTAGDRTGSTTSSGWLSSSGSIDHGRFAPGDVVEGRYRIIGLLGRGGMGEVYRADDLRLGQPVALKLLPDTLASDPQRLAQFHNEVRTARQVSHPNVCTVYDIGDLAAPGSDPPRHQLFLTMEYVDGENLSTLLRRIGRLPEDKAIDIARQVCAGVAAAHARGVIHRDLKPANIMLDNAGHVRLMDFGLASIGEVSDVRAGTPAYMAPEQLDGTGVTPRSDIFALGLVLYELFTGKRAFHAKTVHELVEQHHTGTIVPPSTLVPGLNPAIEQVILRCLRHTPAERPASALSVSAALPGGDPLAAALAAGETPSPQMVAAAGDDAVGLSTMTLISWSVAALVGLIATMLLSNALGLHARIPFDRAPSTLFDRARDIERLVTPDELPPNRAWGVTPRNETLTWLRTNMPASEVDAILRSGRPPAVVFWYRSSRGLLVPDGLQVGVDNPPARAEGDTLIVLDLDGRLLSYERLPPLLVAPPEAAAASTPPDWTPLFQAAGIDATLLTPAAPTYSPRAFAEQREAWIGTWPGASGAELRIEAGATGDTPVYFRTLGPWNRPDTTSAPTSSAASQLLTTVAATIGTTFLILAALVARANVRAGRGDRLGARRLATVVIVILVVRWFFGADHVTDLGIEQNRFFVAIGLAMVEAAMLWIFYLAAEPYARRVCPRILITWSRVLSGAVRDRLVGRDLLIGTACGLAMTVQSYVFHLVPGWMDWPAFAPHTPEMLLGIRTLMTRVATLVSNGMSNAMLGVLGLALLRLALQRLSPTVGTTRAALIVATLLFTPLAASGQFQSGIVGLDLAFGLVSVAIILGVIYRLGLFAGMVGFFVHFTTWRIAFTLDTTQPYYDTSLITALLVAGMAVAGVVLARSRSGE